MTGDEAPTGLKANSTITNYDLDLENCSVIHGCLTATEDKVRTGTNLITSLGACTGHGVTAGVGSAAIKDAFFTIAAVGNLVKPTKKTEMGKGTNDKPDQAIDR